MYVRAKAPLRLSFAGGGTDVPPFPELEGGAVLSATIDRWAHATVRTRQDRGVSLKSLDYGQELVFGQDDQIHFDGRLDLPKAAVLRMLDRDVAGIDVFLHSDAPAGSGLGASSAMIVAIVAALADFNRVPMTLYEISTMAHALERQDLGIRGGLQDHFAAAFGGFNYIEFNSDHVVVNPLRVDEATLNELEENLLLVYTGQTRMSDGIIADQTDRFTAGEPESVEALRRQKDLARQMKDSLLRGRLGQFGELLDASWREKQRMSPEDQHPADRRGVRARAKHGCPGWQGDRGRWRRVHGLLLRVRATTPCGPTPHRLRHDRLRRELHRPWCHHLEGQWLSRLRRRSSSPARRRR